MTGRERRRLDSRSDLKRFLPRITGFLRDEAVQRESEQGDVDGLAGQHSQQGFPEFSVFVRIVTGRNLA